MVLSVLAIFFVWMIYREFTQPNGKFDTFALCYVSVLALLAFACARPVYQTWRLETMLSENASIAANREDVKVKCRSIFGTILAGNALRGMGNIAGTAYIEKKEIYFENNWCKSFKKYLKDPEGASDEEVFSMHVYVHEVMHIRGERNEAKTDCQAIQRGHHVGEMLGVAPKTAKRNTLRYYEGIFKRHPYFSRDCKPGGKLDEKLENSIWSK